MIRSFIFSLVRRRALAKMCNYFHTVYACGHMQRTAGSCDKARVQGVYCPPEKWESCTKVYTCDPCTLRDIQRTRDMTGLRGKTLLGQENTQECPKEDESKEDEKKKDKQKEETPPSK